MILLLKVLTLLIDLIIVKCELHQLPSSFALLLLSHACLLLVLLDALLELLRLCLVATILLMSLAHFADVTLALVFELFDQGLDLVFVLI